MKWLFPTLTGGLPLFALLFSLNLLRKRRAAKTKTPFTEKLLRPPGESLREKIALLDDQISDKVVMFMFICIGIGYFTYSQLGLLQSRGVQIVFGVFLLIGYGVCGLYGVRLKRLVHLRRDYHLGFLGERAVGEELNRMVAQGYEVFHDVQFEGRPGSKNFNIDHVAVGPGGVFSIETKTRRKQVRRGYNSPRNVVEFDGAFLKYPWGSEDFGVRQAQENAQHLASWLQKATGIQIKPIPVLALPGWFVERKGRGDVRAVSGREICSAFPKTNLPAVLNTDQIKQISFLLEQRCRNVEVE